LINNIAGFGNYCVNKFLVYGIAKFLKIFHEAFPPFYTRRCNACEYSIGQGIRKGKVQKLMVAAPAE